MKAATYANGVYLVANDNGKMITKDKHLINKPSNSLIFKSLVKAKDIKALTLGITLGQGSTISVKSSPNSALTFHAFGGEVS
jgi:hypothetical protein